MAITKSNSFTIPKVYTYTITFGKFDKDHGDYYKRMFFSDKKYDLNELKDFLILGLDTSDNMKEVYKNLEKSLINKFHFTCDPCFYFTEEQLNDFIEAYKINKERYVSSKNLIGYSNYSNDNLYSAIKLSENIENVKLTYEEILIMNINWDNVKRILIENNNLYREENYYIDISDKVVF